MCGGSEPFANAEAARKFSERHPVWNPYVCPECRKKRVAERNKLVCSVCGEEIVAKTRYQKRLRRWCGEGKATYTCQKCKVPNRDYQISLAKTKRVPLIKTPEYLDLSSKCSNLYKEFVASGFSDRGLDRLMTGLRELLESNHIYDFDLNVVNGFAEGILLHDVSVYGEVYVPFV